MNGVAELADAVRRKQRSAVELTREHLEREDR